MKQSQLIESTSELLSGLKIHGYKKGFQNTVIRTMIGDEEIYIKIYAEQDNFLVESSALQQLKNASLSLPQLRAHHRNICTNILTSVPGRALCREDCCNDVFDRFVTVLRILHQSAYLQEGNKMQMSTLLDLYMRRIDESIHVKQEEKRLVWQVIQRIRSTLQSVARKCFVHGDLNAGNILYCPDVHGIGFIDFERARQDHPFADLAKFSWRVLDNDIDYVRELLIRYLQRSPNRQEEEIFNAYMALESIGAISYYAYQGYANNYPYKDQAMLNICLWPLLR